jgi:hypothetical protein
MGNLSDEIMSHYHEYKFTLSILLNSCFVMENDAIFAITAVVDKIIYDYFAWS